MSQNTEGVKAYVKYFPLFNIVGSEEPVLSV